MKTLILILTTLLLNGCGKDDHICPPQKPCLFPVFKTYKQPPSTPITKPKILSDGTCIVVFSEFKELYKNNKYLRAQLDRCNRVFIKTNNIYNPKEKE